MNNEETYREMYGTICTMLLPLTFLNVAFTLWIIPLLFNRLQEAVFLNSKMTMFIGSGDKLSSLLFANEVLAILLVTNILERYKKSIRRDNGKRKYTKLLFNIISAGCLIYSSIVFINYSYLTKDGLYMNNNHYNWKDIKSGNIEVIITKYQGSKDGAEVKYILNLADGKNINLISKAQKDFTNIIEADNILKLNNVTIINTHLSDELIYYVNKTYSSKTVDKLLGIQN